MTRTESTSRHPQRLAAAGVLLLWAFLLAACKASPQTDRLANNPKVSHQDRPAFERVACPAQDFKAFLDAFIEDEAVQRAYIRSPYKVTSYDPQDLEAPPAVTELPLDRVTFPVILSRAEMDRQGVVIEIEEKGPRVREVSTHSEGSGAYSRTFHFEMADGCWRLAGSVEAST